MFEILAPLIFTGAMYGSTPIMLCLHVPRMENAPPRTIDLIVDYCDAYSPDDYMRLVTRTVRQVDERTSRECFGPYRLQEGNYTMHVLLHSGEQTVHREAPVRVLGERDIRLVGNRWNACVDSSLY
jgi:hypothetical protein